MPAPLLTLLLALVTGVDGTRGAHVAARGDAGRVRVVAGVEDRFAVAEAIARAAHAAGLPLVELRHEVPTLERGFLERTRRAAVEAES